MKQWKRNKLMRQEEQKRIQISNRLKNQHSSTELKVAEMSWMKRNKNKFTEIAQKKL